MKLSQRYKFKPNKFNMTKIIVNLVCYILRRLQLCYSNAIKIVVLKMFIPINECIYVHMSFIFVYHDLNVFFFKFL